MYACRREGRGMEGDRERAQAAVLNYITTTLSAASGSGTSRDAHQCFGRHAARTRRRQKRRRPPFGGRHLANLSFRTQQIGHSERPPRGLPSGRSEEPAGALKSAADPSLAFGMAIWQSRARNADAGQSLQRAADPSLALGMTIWQSRARYADAGQIVTWRSACGTCPRGHWCP